MLTAVDTSVLLDVFGADPRHGRASAAALNLALQQGGVVACDVVWAETRSMFPSNAAFATAMQTLGVGFSAVGADSAATAGACWQHYRARGGKRTRVVADFIIASHARHQCNRLLTRDRGFYRDYFKGLTLVEPSSV